MHGPFEEKERVTPKKSAPENRDENDLKAVASFRYRHHRLRNRNAETARTNGQKHPQILTTAVASRRSR
jgi:hypothetical protein